MSNEFYRANTEDIKEFEIPNVVVKSTYKRWLEQKRLHEAEILVRAYKSAVMEYAYDIDNPAKTKAMKDVRADLLAFITVNNAVRL